MATASRPRPDAREALRLAAGHATRGELEPAMRLLKELLTAEPDHEIANGMLAGIYAELNMPERAAAGYERVLAVNPRNALARFQLGVLQLNSGEPARAVATLRPNLADDAEFLSRFYSALALLELHQTEEARILLQETERRMPVDHHLYPELQALLQPLRR